MKPTHTEVVLLAPLSGPRVALSQVPDPVFAQGVVGQGWAIDPTSEEVCAPCDGEVVQIHRAGHALTLRSEDGLELLIHVGIDTVSLGGAGFESLVKVGMQVRAGQPLLRFELDTIARQARSMLTPVLVTNPDAFESLTSAAGGTVMQAGRSVLGTVRLRRVAPSASGPVNAQRLRSEPVRIPNPAGLHARPSALLAEAARAYSAELLLHCGSRTGNAKSVVSLMGLDVRQGDEVSIEAEGVDAETAVDALAKLLVAGCGEAHDGIPHPTSRAPAPTPPAAAHRPPDSFAGVAAAPGVAIGRLLHWKTSVVMGEESPAGEPPIERARLDHALHAAHAELLTLVSAHAGDTRGQILAAQAGMLDDPELRDTARAVVMQGASAGAAWLQVTNAAAARLLALDNPLMRERAADLRDLGGRVARLLGGRALRPDVPAGAILVAEELAPSDVAGFDPAIIAGLCSLTGGASSHVAILARSLGIPAVCGVDAAVLRLEDGAEVLLDGDHGWLQPEPDADAVSGARERLRSLSERHAREQAFAHREARTADGVRVEVVANVATEEETLSAMQAGAEGVGLLRTEWLFDGRAAAPSEDEQLACYVAIAKAVGHAHPLVIRTLDAGGDKPLSYLPMPTEDNPFLGMRGIRVSLAQPDLLRTQLRAILRAGDHARVQVMLPMVATLDEVHRVRAMLLQESEALRLPPVPLGIMVEVPSAALLAEQLAREVDFFSIGSNDLTQYTLAMDRGHPVLTRRADALHPAVLHLIARTCEAAERHQRWVGVCGAMASDPLATPALIGLGVRELSVVTPAIAAIKAALAGLDSLACQGLARELLTLGDAESVRARLHAFCTS